MGSRKDLVTQFAEIAADLRDAARPGASDSERTRQIIINGIYRALRNSGFSADQTAMFVFLLSSISLEDGKSHDTAPTPHP